VNEQERQVVEMFYKQNPQWRRDANTSFLLQRSTKPVTVESLVAAAYLLRDTLLLGEGYDNAWEDYKFYHPGEAGLAHRAIFIEKLRAKEMQEAEAVERAILVKSLGDKFKDEPLQRLREIAEKRRVYGLTASEFKAEARRTGSEGKTSRV
jgi:hypothetical protein